MKPGDYLVKDAWVLLLQVNTEDIELPAVSEGDYLSLLNAGGYGSASSSNHCMRGKFSEYLLIDEYMNDSGMQLTQFKPLSNNE